MQFFVEDFSKISYQLSSHNIFTLNDSPLRKIYVDLALGNFASAAKILEMFSKQPDYWKERMYTESEFNRLISELFQMVETENKPAIAALLHKWEAYSVKQLKLEKYWQKTPFPIEL